MGIRTAIDHNPIVTFGLLFAAVWTLLITLTVATQMRTPAMGDWVGHHGIGGLMGLLVLTAFLVLILAAFGALGEPDPAPQEWPPE